MRIPPFKREAVHLNSEHSFIGVTCDSSQFGLIDERRATFDPRDRMDVSPVSGVFGDPTVDLVQFFDMLLSEHFDPIREADRCL